MTRVLFTVTITIAGDVTAVHVYDDAPIPFWWDRYSVIDEAGGMVRDEDWEMVGEDKR